MSFDSLLNLSCSIQLNTPTQQAGTGKQVDVWSNVVTGVKCRLDARSGGVKDNREFIFEQATHLLFMRPNATVTPTTESHRIVIAGSNYKIHLVQTRYATSALNHLELLLELVT